MAYRQNEPISDPLSLRQSIFVSYLSYMNSMILKCILIKLINKTSYQDINIFVLIDVSVNICITFNFADFVHQIFSIFFEKGEACACWCNWIFWLNEDELMQWKTMLSPRRKFLMKSLYFVYKSILLQHSKVATLNQKFPAMISLHVSKKTESWSKNKLEGALGR